MCYRIAFTITAAAAFAGCAQLVHVPPGTSVELALAKKPEVLRMPEPPPGDPSAPGAVASTAKPKVRHLNLPAVEPALPTNDSVTAVAEAFTRGTAALEHGQNDVAINAFQQAVQIDPKFGEAWQKLAMAYEKVGKSDKAREAYRNSKEMTSQ
jgi:tetratricopeptide (TPR) repeat protein